MSQVKVIKGTMRQFEEFYRLFAKSLRSGQFAYPPAGIPYILHHSLPKHELKRKLADGEKYCFLGYVRNTLAGYLLTDRVHTGVSFGHWLAVDSAFQNLGVASKLLSFWERHEKRRGAHAVYLWTTRDNTRFYRRRKFMLSGRFPKSFLGVDHFLFTKALRKPQEKLFLRT